MIYFYYQNKEIMDRRKAMLYDAKKVDLPKELYDSIEKLYSCEKKLINHYITIADKNGNLYDRDLIIAIIYNKSVNIIDCICDACARYNISSQIALMRIFVDSCITVYRAAQIGASKFLQHIFNHDKLNELKINGTKLSDNYVKKQISKDFLQFDDLYNWACKGVHFSEIALMSTLRPESDRSLVAKIAVGNKERVKDIIQNNTTICECVDMLMKCVEKYLLTLPRGESLT